LFAGLFVRFFLDKLINGFKNGNKERVSKKDGVLPLMSAFQILCPARQAMMIVSFGRSDEEGRKVAPRGASLNNH